MAPVILLALFGACAPASQETAEPPPAGGPASADAGARALADSIVAACGGWEGWKDARYLEFRFVVLLEGAERRRTSHRWDRHTGDSRIEGVDKDGKPFVVVWNEKTGIGEARRDGQPVGPEELAAALERAQQLLVNDSYWLLVPFKLHDPGVHLSDAGARTDSTGRVRRVLALSFDEGTGLTSKDRYWLFVEPGTGRVDGWEYLLESAEPGSPPTVFAWSEPVQTGAIRLAQEKRSADGRLVIRFEEVVAAPAPPSEAFRF